MHYRKRALRRFRFALPNAANISIENLEYGQRDVAKALKRFLIDQFVKFFLLIASKHF